MRTSTLWLFFAIFAVGLYGVTNFAEQRAVAPRVRTAFRNVLEAKNVEVDVALRVLVPSSVLGIEAVDAATVPIDIVGTAGLNLDAGATNGRADFRMADVEAGNDHDIPKIAWIGERGGVQYLKFENVPAGSQGPVDTAKLNGRWFSLPATGAVDVRAGISKFLAESGMLDASLRLGTETVDGAETVHYALGIDDRAFVPLAERLWVAATGKAMNKEESRAVQAFALTNTARAEAWIEPGNDQLKRLVISLQPVLATADEPLASLTLDFTSFNTPVEVQPPPESVPFTSL